MRLRLDQLRRLLNEARASKPFVNHRSIVGMQDAAFIRLKHASGVESDGVITTVLTYDNSRVKIEVEAPDSSPDYWRAVFTINLSDPFNPTKHYYLPPKRSSDMSVDPRARRKATIARPEVQAVVSKFMDLAKPEPVGGDWWLDKGGTIVRPVYVGEELSPPPAKGWTIVDGFSHVGIDKAKPKRIGEAIERAPDYRVNPKSVNAVWGDAQTAFRKALKDHASEVTTDEFRYDVVTLSSSDTLIQVYDIPNGSHKGFRFSTSTTQVTVSYRGRVMDPEVRVSGTSAYDTDDNAHTLELIEFIKDNAPPQPQTSGLWWTDEHGELVRALVNGEMPSLPPVNGWEAVNAADYIDPKKWNL